MSDEVKEASSVTGAQRAHDMHDMHDMGGKWCAGDKVLARRAYSKCWECATIARVSEKFDATHRKELDGDVAKTIAGPLYWVRIDDDPPHMTVPRWESELRASTFATGA